MSKITKEFHSICIYCRGIDCDIINRCDGYINIETNVNTDYFRHKFSLKSKLKYKRKVKEPLLSDSVIVDQSNASNAPSSVNAHSVSFLSLIDIRVVSSH